MASKAREIQNAVRQEKTKRYGERVDQAARVAAKRRRWHDATGDSDFHRTANRRK